MYHVYIILKNCCFYCQKGLFSQFFQIFQIFGKICFSITEAYLVSKDAQFRGKFDLCSEIVQFWHVYNWKSQKNWKYL